MGKEEPKKFGMNKMTKEEKNTAIKTMVLPSPFSSEFSGMMSFGWGNGYVGVPPAHPWYGKGYGEIDVDVHGGLTFGDHQGNMSWDDHENEDLWWYGFDTFRIDEFALHNKKWVLDETERLKEQAIEAWID
jgi:hypothetical protein